MNEILIQKGIFLDKIAYIQDKSLKKIKITFNEQKYFEKDIFLAKMKKHNSSMNSLTLSLDDKTEGFMHYKKEEEKKEYILCQVKKLYNNDKNIKLTSEITLSGKYIIYIKGSVGVSISNKSQKKHLVDIFRRQIDEDILKDTKIILRARLDEKDIKNAVEELYEFDKTYKEIRQKARLISKPQLIYRQYENEEMFLSKINEDIDKLVINDKKTIEKLKKSRFKINETIYRSEDIFEKEGINSQIKEILSDKIVLKSGINLYIQKTEAMHIIDVNSAGYFKYKDTSKNAYYINSLVIPEIIRQINLRDISGIILIDFIDMNSPIFEKKLMDLMQEFLDKDEKKASVTSMTKSSLMQIIRKKEELSLSETLQDENNIKLDSTEYIFEQISLKLTNMGLEEENSNTKINEKHTCYDDKNNLQNTKKNVEIHIPTFETDKTKKYIKILEENYNIKITPTYIKKSNFNIRINNIEKH